MKEILYLGDGVYVAIEHGQIKLMTGSHLEPSNTVYMEPEVHAALVLWVASMKDKGKL